MVCWSDMAKFLSSDVLARKLATAPHEGKLCATLWWFVARLTTIRLKTPCGGQSGTSAQRGPYLLAATSTADSNPETNVGGVQNFSGDRPFTSRLL